MKLIELIDFEPRQSNKLSAQYNQRVRAVPGAKSIGYGAFSTAFDINSPKRLNQITKVGRAGSLDASATQQNEDNFKNDGYLTYIHEIYEGDLKNPYFPVVHDLKILRSNHNNKLHYRANIEKLIPFDSNKLLNNIDLMTSLCEYMFRDQPLSVIAPEEIYDFIIRSLRAGLRDPKFIVDEDLKEALKLIKRIISKNPKFHEDMHGGNLMWRITGTMPHLVILDPIA